MTARPATVVHSKIVIWTDQSSRGRGVPPQRTRRRLGQFARGPRLQLWRDRQPCTPSAVERARRRSRASRRRRRRRWGGGGGGQRCMGFRQRRSRRAHPAPVRYHQARQPPTPPGLSPSFRHCLGAGERGNGPIDDGVLRALRLCVCAWRVCGEAGV